MWATVLHIITTRASHSSEIRLFDPGYWFHRQESSHIRDAMQNPRKVLSKMGQNLDDLPGGVQKLEDWERILAAGAVREGGDILGVESLAF